MLTGSIFFQPVQNLFRLVIGFLMFFADQRCQVCKHPGRTEHNITTLQHFTSFQGKLLCAAHAHADHTEKTSARAICFAVFRRPGRPVRIHLSLCLFQRDSFLVDRTPDHDHGYAALPCSLYFLRKAAALSGFLCDKPPGLHGTQQRIIQFHRKRSLHGNDVGAVKAKILTFFKDLTVRKDPCKDAFPQNRIPGKRFQFLASGGKENRAAILFQARSCLTYRIHHKYRRQILSVFLHP